MSKFCNMLPMNDEILTKEDAFSALPPKRRTFVEEYLVDLNATQAATRAGYSPKAAEVTGHRLLRDDKIAAAIDAAMRERSARLGVKQDNVLTEIARVAFSDVRKLFDGQQLKSIDDLDDATAAAVASVKVVTKNLGDGQVEYVHEIKLWPKTQALDMAGRHIGIFERDNKQRNPEDIIAKFFAEVATRQQPLVK